MDLYPPLFIPRPTVEPALFASLRPPTYGGPITNAAINLPNFGVQGGAGFGGGFQGSGNNPAMINGLMQNGQPGNFNPMFNYAQGQFGNLGGQFGQQGGQLGMNSFNNRYSNSVNVDNNLMNNKRLTWNEMQGRRNNEQQQSDNVKGQQKAIAQQLGSALTNVDPDFIERVRAADE